MTLIGILIALALERLLGHLPGWGRPVLFLAAMQGLQRLMPVALWRSWLMPLVVVALPAALAWWLLDRTEGPILRLCLSAALLLLCLGPRDLAEDVHELLQARAAGDQARAAQLERALQRGPSPGETHRSLAGALFIQSHERLFGVLLWFFAAGPAGAVFYRLASRMPRFVHETRPDTAAEHAAVTLHAAAAWIPSRINALLFGLAGSLDQALVRWRALRAESFANWRERTWAVLAEVSAASLTVEEGEAGPMVPASLEECLREVAAMQNRALLILLAAFALFSAGVFAP